MKRWSNRIAAVVAIGLTGGVAAPALADPCGMVPPITMIEGDPIVRVGAQKTYVAYYKGIETVVLRPGFEGKVDEFGMLIPFPSVPAIRKVDDNIFPHIAAAIDPPEVLAYVQNAVRRRGRVPMRAPMAATGGAAGAEAPLRYDEVRVVKQEAVGMYEVAVLEAGSAAALNKWMDQHQFRYPEGMDDVVNDYVADRWVFVAVKTKVGQKAGVNPRPGMKAANAKLPAGATFSGHVQAMGFRFRSDELVVPMRLSAFNKGKLHNVVYVLTDDPVAIRRIPKRFVRRQLSGAELYRNLTGPLPLRVIGGTYRQLTPWQKQNLVKQRDPEPHNGLAKDLIASDLLAITSGTLSNPFEEQEKELLAIGERLGLRGAEIDALHAQVLAKAKERAVRKALRRVKALTMTVIDGEFDRDVLARDNLRFATYRVPARRNKPEAYDARHMGPRPRRGGRVYRGKGASIERQELLERQRLDRRHRIDDWFRRLGFGMVVVFAGIAFARRRRGAVRWLVPLALIAGAGGIAAATPGRATTAQLIEQLSDRDHAEAAVAELARRGADAIDPLLDAIADADEETAVGWAIVALSEIGDPRVDAELDKIHASTAYSMLVRTWAAAARIARADTLDALAAVAPLAQTFPAVQRPLGLRAAALVGDGRRVRDLDKLLALAQTPALRQALAPAVSAVGAPRLVRAMLRAPDMRTRQLAAAYVPAARGNPAAAVRRALRFSPRARDVPWRGGPLYVPALQWSKDDAAAVVEALLRWHLWADLHGRPDEQTKIDNALRVWPLRSAAGYGQPRGGKVSTEQWLLAWGRAAGRDRVRAILAEQGVARQPRWRRVLTVLR